MNQGLDMRPARARKWAFDLVPVTLDGLGVNLFISGGDKLNTVVHHFVIVTQAF